MHILILQNVGVPLFNSIFIGPDAFGERELCVIVLYSFGPDSYLTVF